MGSFLELIIEFTGELIIEILPRFYGALLKWIYYGGQRRYSDILEEKGTIRWGYISLGVTVLFILLFLNG